MSVKSESVKTKSGKYILGVDGHLLKEQNNKYKISELKKKNARKRKALWSITLGTELNTRSELDSYVCFY